jgi:hypothetical protein
MKFTDCARASKNILFILKSMLLKNKNIGGYFKLKVDFKN